MNNDIFEFPATATQQALWFMHQLAPSSSAYNISVVTHFNGPLDQHALKNAFSQLLQRHEILRTVFVEQKGKAIQQVNNTLAMDWRRSSCICSGDMYNQAVQDFIREPFKLSSQPLIRAHLFGQNDDWVFALCLHHIIIDHGALQLLCHELSELYQDYINDKVNSQQTVDLAPLQFADYSIWQQENVNDDEAAHQIQYWQQQLKDASDFLDLPAPKPRPQLQSNQGEEVRFQFDETLSEKLTAFAGENAVSPFILMLSILKVLLSRYSNQDHITVGTPFDLRGEEEELSTVMGCFINVLPHYNDISKAKTFTELLNDVKTTLLEAYDNKDTSLEDIINALQPQRDPSFNPLFQVGMVYQDAPVHLQLENLIAHDVPVHNGGAMYDLHHWFWNDNGIIQGLIWYCSDIFDQPWVADFIHNLQSLAENLITNPHARLNDIATLSKNDIQKLTSMSTKLADKNAYNTVLNDIVRNAKNHPQRIAISSSNGQYSYKEIDDRSDKLANYLSAQHIKKGDFIGIALQRDHNLIIAILGIWKVGAVYVPLDTQFPVQRIQYMIDTAKLTSLICDTSTSEFLSFYTGDKLHLDLSWPQITAAENHPHIPLSFDDIAYLLFTSGSTGKPKGVMVPHGCLDNFITSMAKTPGLTQDDKCLSVTTLSFDISTLELFLPIYVGAEVFIANHEESQDGKKLRTIMQKQDINFMQATPATWRMLLAAGWQGQQHMRILCGGEALPHDLINDLLPIVAQMWNMYGPTETTVWSTCHLLSKEDKTTLIGAGIDNTLCYVMSPSSQLQPDGVPGELYIGGLGVTAGYLQQAELTNKHFVTDPFINNQRCYRTGDLVKRHANGLIEYIQRIDNQVKIRGFRVELEEIEVALMQHDSVKTCIVEAKAFSPLDTRLIAYIKFSDQHVLTNTEVRAFLRTKLPHYMIPQLIVEMDTFPLTQNGKIDRKALVNPYLSLEKNTDVVVAETNNEKFIIELCQNIIGVEGIGKNEYFFDVGGHSLLSMQVISNIEEHYGIRLNPRDMVLNTFEQIAALLPENAALSAQEKFSEVDEKAFSSVNFLSQKIKDSAHGLRSIFGQG